ncbi:SGNH hydrolase domain-containing protein [Mycolicibacterium litorale]|uniref:SGNH hydrolase domain-containing protein n=1 Tax=Mycolicibacterium litorale TaxID=758802 RepID=UPI0039A10C95
MGWAARFFSAFVFATMLTSCSEPPAYESRYTPSPATKTPSETSGSQVSGPLGEALQAEIATALEAKTWPPLEPSMESVIAGPVAPPELEACGLDGTPAEQCTWGSADAPVHAVLVGDSVALTYAPAFREMALVSGGTLQVHFAALPGCSFVDDILFDESKALVESCPARRQRVIDYINERKPGVVLVAHAYGLKYLASGPELTAGKWAESLQRNTSKINSDRVVLLAAPPAEKNIRECFIERGSTPQECASLVNRRWHAIATTERNLAHSANWTWLDSRPWFCKATCPAFVGSTPTKSDLVHITPAYATKIAPVIAESLQRAGVL